jgi:hypothetical protein
MTDCRVDSLTRLDTKPEIWLSTGFRAGSEIAEVPLEAAILDVETAR